MLITQKKSILALPGVLNRVLLGDRLILICFVIIFVTNVNFTSYVYCMRSLCGYLNFCQILNIIVTSHIPCGQNHSHEQS